jgi:AhpD family alkylhydroperoxidase
MPLTFIDHTTESAPAAARAALEGAARKFGHVPSPLARLAESPSAVAAFHSGLGHFDRSSLDMLEREVVVFVVATRNECHYCVALHSLQLTTSGVDADLLVSLREQRPLGDGRLEALRQFTHAVLDTRGDVDDAARAAFFAAGYTAQQALDVVVGIATYTLSTLANRLTRAPLDAPLERFRWTAVR